MSKVEFAKSILVKRNYFYQKEAFFLQNMMWERLKAAALSGEMSSDSEDGAAITEKDQEVAQIRRAKDIFREATEKSAQIIEEAKGETQKIIKKALADSQSQAEQITAEAEAKAQKFIAESEKQGKDIRESAYGKGYEEGFLKGIKEGSFQGESKGFEKWQDCINRWEEALKGILAQKEIFLKQSESSLFELAIAIAEKVIAGSVPLDKKIILRQVQEAIKQSIDKEWVLVRVNSEDFETLKKARTDLVEKSGIQKIEIIEDDSIGAGGCIIETPSGNIDSRLTEQMNAVVKELREV